MSKLLKIVFTVVIVALVAGTVYCWYGWSLTKQDLLSTRTELASTQVSLRSHQRELSATQGELDTTITQLQTSRSQLSGARDKLQDAKNELQDAKDNLSTVEAELGSVKARLSSRHGDTLHLHNPTLEEVLEFLREDKANFNRYVEDEYVCAHFARDVNNHAESLGIRCAIVVLRYPGLVDHAIVAFDTMDEGMVYFEPITDERVRPEIGKEYWRCVEPKLGSFYYKPEFDDTIEDIVVIW